VPVAGEGLPVIAFTAFTQNSGFCLYFAPQADLFIVRPL
jgi:hypothetical protein